jgi:hypothetical protein
MEEPIPPPPLQLLANRDVHGLLINVGIGMLATGVFLGMVLTRMWYKK